MGNTSPARSLAHIPLANERAVYGSIFGKEAAPNTNFSANPSNEILASQLIQHYLKRKNNPDDALAAIRGWKEPLKMKTIQQVLDENIGSAPRNPTTGKKERRIGSVEEMRYTTAFNRLQQVDKILRVGFDRLPASEKQFVLSEVESALRRIPNVSAYLNHPPSGITKKECLEQLINNPNFGSKLREITNTKVLGGENGEGVQLTKQTVEVVANQEESEKLYQRKLIQIQELKEKIRKTDRKLDDFEPADPSVGRVQGSRYLAIQDGAASEAALATKRSDIEKARLGVNSTMRSLGNLYNYNNPNQNQIIILESKLTQEENRLSQLENELTTAEQKVQAYTSAITKQQELEAKKDGLEEKLDQAEIEIISLEKSRSEVSATLGDSRYEREKAEEVFVEGIEDIIKDAALDTFETEVQSAQDTQAELVKKAEEEAISDEKRAVEEAITNRYDESIIVHPPFGAPREVRILQKRRIKKDFQLLINTRGGPEEVMRKVLLSTRIPDKSPGASVGATKRFTPDEVANALADPEFMKEMQPILLQQLITRQLRVGRMRSGDVRYLLESSWGEEMINHAQQTNQKFTSKVEELRAQGIVTGPFIEFLRHTRAGSRLSWLMLACGLVPGSFLGPHIVPAIAPALGKGLASVARAIPGALPYAAATGAAVVGAQALVDRNAA